MEPGLPGAPGLFSFLQQHALGRGGRNRLRLNRHVLGCADIVCTLADSLGNPHLRGKY